MMTIYMNLSPVLLPHSDSLTDNIWVFSSWLTSCYLQTSVTVALRTNCDLSAKATLPEWAQQWHYQSKGKVHTKLHVQYSRAWLHVCTSTKQSCKIRRSHAALEVHAQTVHTAEILTRIWTCICICVFPVMEVGCGSATIHLHACMDAWRQIPRLFLITKLRYEMQGILFSNCPLHAPHSCTLCRLRLPAKWCFPEWIKCTSWLVNDYTTGWSLSLKPSYLLSTH